MEQIAPRYKSVVFDADSTLSAIEGIDWIAGQRGDEVSRVVRELTERAMNGELPLESVYSARLDVIRPTRRDVDRLADAYLESIQPGAIDLCARLRHANVSVHIVSGGLCDALLPMARALGIPSNHVHAVHLHFDASGRYAGLVDAQSLTQQDGKAVIVRELALARPSVMIGDGATDAVARAATDAFFAYTGVVERQAVVAVANAVARNFSEVASLLFQPGGRTYQQ